MQPHEGHVQHVAGAQRIPRVAHAVLPPADADALRLHLAHPGQAAPLGVAVMPPLQHDVDERVGDGGDLRLGDQRQQFGDIVIVHGMHGGQVAGRHPPVQAKPLHLIGQRFDMARQRVVGFVAMDVHRQAAVGGDLAELGQRGRALFHRAFEMRDAAHHVHAHVERAQQVLPPGGAAQEAVLRKGHQLQVEIGFHPLAHLQHGGDGVQMVRRGVHMGADRQQAQRHGPVAIGQGAVHHLVDRGLIAQFAPEADAFEQRARGVDARRAVAERRIHVEMRIDKGRADQIALRVDHLARVAAGKVAHGGDAVAGDADIQHAAIGQGAARHKKVKAGHQRSPRLKGVIRAAGISARRDIRISARIDSR